MSGRSTRVVPTERTGEDAQTVSLAVQMRGGGHLGRKGRHAPPTGGGRWWRFIAAMLVVLLGALTLPLLTVGSIHDLPPPLNIRVQGVLRFTPPGTTFDQMIDRYHLQPKAGSLLDVQDQVLEEGKYPGRVLLDGGTQVGDVALSDGDRIWVVNGKDRTEPLAKTTLQIPAGRPGNPQFTLTTAPGIQITTKGAISAKVVSVIFQQTGRSTTPPAVALTFDDGPWPDSSMKILSILKKYKVKATFFVVGVNLERYPTVVQAELAAGMRVGNHSWDHPTSPSLIDLPVEKVRQEIQQTQDLLAKHGDDTTLFRPPGGFHDDALVATASDFGDRLVLWSIDPRDWENGVTTKQIVKRVLSNVKPGSIILLHDGGADRGATIAALPKIIKGVRARGLGFALL